MKKFLEVVLRLIKGSLIFMLANSYSMIKGNGVAGIVLLGLIGFFVWVSIIPNLSNRKLLAKRLCTCANGCELLWLFLISTAISVIYSLVGWTGHLACGSLIEDPVLWIINTLIIILVESIVFWNGIIRIYVSSAQLGIRWRVLGIVCGWIPVVHLIVLGKLIHIVTQEVRCEQEKLLLNQARKDQGFCQTRYPILLVHGVFFRDSNYFNYWGRIPKELEENGARVFYGNHQSAASVAECGRELDRKSVV